MFKDFDISQEKTGFLCCKQNVVLKRLAYSHQSLCYAYIYVLRWNATLSGMNVRQLAEPRDYGL